MPVHVDVETRAFQSTGRGLAAYLLADENRQQSTATRFIEKPGAATILVVDGTVRVPLRDGPCPRDATGFATIGGDG